MKTTLIASLTTLCIFAGAGAKPCRAETLVEADFSKGNFAALDWSVSGDWDVFAYPGAADNPGAVARFAANKPDGSLTKTFAEIKSPHKLSLSLDYGWGWGSADQGADAVSFMLLDRASSGYLFEVHRCKARWAVQWGKVVRGQPTEQKTWASADIDASHPAVRDGGGLSRVSIVREADASWVISSNDWNQGAGASLRFADATTSAFSQLVLLGTKNFDDQLFNKIVLTAESRDAAASRALPATDFLNSIGVVTTFPDRGQPLPRTIDMLRFAGFRWVRGGIEGLTTDGPTTLETYLDLHRQTGCRFSWGLVSGGTDIAKLIETAKRLAAANALLAFEGNNEPNNWGVIYQGEKGGRDAASWQAVAKLQRDLYAAVKGDPALQKFPVWTISAGGAEVDNVGLQFLTIPAGAETALAAGTKFADFANVHNYIYHPSSPDLQDNKTWNAADPTSACKVDGLYGNFGITWAKHFQGYSEAELIKLPRVTTETGCTVDGPVTEEIHARNLLTMYLDQFKRGWSNTAVYLLRDRTDEAGNQSFGFFKPDYAPRKAALYLHNLTAILDDRAAPAKSGRLEYTVSEQPATVHDLLLQKSDGTFALVLWGERVTGTDDATVRLGDTYADVRVFDPTVGSEAIKTLRNVDSLTLTLSDHPLVVAIRPK